MRVVRGHSHRDRTLTGERLACRDVEGSAADFDRATKGFVESVVVVEADAISDRSRLVRKDRG